MTPDEILDALRQLPPAERLLVIEAALRMTREEMAQGAAQPHATRRSGPLPASRRSLPDVEEEESDEQDKQSGFLQKIFKVFTQED